MKLAKCLIQGGSGGVIAGALLGLTEALFHLATAGAPDLLAPFYAVILYSLLGLPMGLGAGLAALAVDKFKELTEGQMWAFGACGAVTPMGAFILRYLANKVVYAEQGVPITGTLAILVGVGILDLILLFGVARILDGPAKPLLTAKGLGGVWGSLAVVTAIVAMIPTGGDPRANFGAGKSVPAALKDKPNVLIIMVDTLRADYLPAYGAKDIETPVLDGFVADSLLFAQNVAAASWTRSSGASIFTSRIPSGHNAPLKASRLPNEVVTWAEALQANGVATGALINNINLTSTFNFDQGYDSFLYESPDYVYMATESVFNLTMYKVVHKLNEKIFKSNKQVSTFYQPGEVVLDDARTFIEANSSARWGLFVHLMEPHDPYFEHPYIDGSGSAQFNGVGYARAEHEHPDPSDENVAYLKKVYKHEIVHMDNLLKPFFDWLKSSGNYDNTVIVLCADHGEEFAEHGGFWHGTTLYDEQIHTPLIVKLPNQEAGGTRVPWQVRNIDIAPTVAAQLGIAADPSWEGSDVIGEVKAELAKLDAAQKAPEPAEEPMAKAKGKGKGKAKGKGKNKADEGKAAKGKGKSKSKGKAKLARLKKSWKQHWCEHPLSRTAISEENFEGNVLSSIRKLGGKYTTANEGNPRGVPVTSLYDMQNDPLELKNITGDGGAICGYGDEGGKSFEEQLAEELELALKAAESGAASGGKACLDDAEIQQLVALGYMSADEAASAERCE